jgi:AcrR family transcriptional regulator
MAVAKTTYPPGPAEVATDTRARIIEAGIHQCEEVGLRRTTVEDIAQRARLSRITVYRHFGSKEELVRSIILAEADRFFQALAMTVATCGRAEERLVEGFAFALEFLRGHALFQRLLRTEPEALLPHLVRDGNLIAVTRVAVASLIADDRMSAEDGEQFAELLARLVLSLALNPDSALGTDDHEGARRVARRFLVPALRPA